MTFAAVTLVPGAVVAADHLGGQVVVVPKTTTDLLPFLSCPVKAGTGLTFGDFARLLDLPGNELLDALAREPVSRLALELRGPAGDPGDQIYALRVTAAVEDGVICHDVSGVGHATEDHTNEELFAIEFADPRRWLNLPLQISHGPDGPKLHPPISLLGLISAVASELTFFGTREGRETQLKELDDASAQMNAETFESVPWEPRDARRTR